MLLADFPVSCWMPGLVTALRLLVPGYIMLEEYAVKAYRPLDVCNITSRPLSPLLAVQSVGTLTLFFYSQCVRRRRPCERFCGEER